MVCLPPHKKICVNIFRPRELAEYNLVIFFYYFFFINIILTQKTQRICHDTNYQTKQLLNSKYSIKLPEHTKTEIIFTSSS